MISYRYPTRVVMRDYLLSAIGIALFFPPIALMNLPQATNLILSALVGLFLIFGLQNYRRHRIRIELCDDGLLIVPGNRKVLWRALSRLVLSYFTVRRDGERGWMELKLVSDGRSIRLDSRLEGFSEVVARAARAASRNGLELDKATVTNLTALGVYPPETDISHAGLRR